MNNSQSLYIARLLPALFKYTDVVGREAMVQLHKTRYQQCVDEGYTLAIIHQLLIIYIAIYALYNYVVSKYIYI